MELCESIRYCHSCGSRVHQISFLKSNHCYYIVVHYNVMTIKLSVNLCYDILKAIRTNDYELLGFISGPEQIFDIKYMNLCKFE